MTLHVCRDFLVESSFGPSSSLYLAAMFTFGVMGWSIVGSTNFDLTGSAYLVSSGSSGSLNLGPGQEWWFEPEPGIHTFSHANDIDRILVLRSDSNPQVNSGLFRVRAVNSGSASFAIDYRSPQYPPPESGSLTWYLFRSEDETLSEIPAMPRTGDGGPAANYHASGSAADNARIILQSPTSASWQVRYCLETESDVGSSTAIGGNMMSIAPGFGGTPTGDFQVGGEHLHGPMHYNVGNDLGYGMSAAAFNPEDSTGRFRFYAWGEDEFPGAFVFASQTVENSHSTWAAFGFCEDENLPLPPKTVHRLFSMGGASNSSPHQAGLTWVTAKSNSQASEMTVVGFDRFNRTTLGNMSTWCFLAGQTSLLQSPRIAGSPHLPNDSGLTYETELVPVDVMIGTWDTRENDPDFAPAIFHIFGRRLGRFPIARFGHAYSGDWELIEHQDQRWLHLTDGIYLPWSGSTVP